MRRGRREGRRGLTKVDLVVVLVLALTAGGLVRVTTLRARESSDRVQCAKPWKGLGEAVLEHDKLKRYLPASRIDARHATWAVLLAPYLSKKGPNPLRDWDLQKPYAAQTDQARQ